MKTESDCTKCATQIYTNRIDEAAELMKVAFPSGGPEGETAFSNGLRKMLKEVVLQSLDGYCQFRRGGVIEDENARSEAAMCVWNHLIIQTRKNLAAIQMMVEQKAIIGVNEDGDIEMHVQALPECDCNDLEPEKVSDGVTPNEHLE